jgi:hypothetical protein
LLTSAPAAFAGAKQLSPKSSHPRRGIDEPAFPEAETGHHLSHTDFVDPAWFVTRR